MNDDEGIIQPDNEVAPVGLYEKILSVVRDTRDMSELKKSFIKVGLVMFPARVKHYPIKGIFHIKVVVEVTFKLVDCETGSYEFIMTTGDGENVEEAIENAFRIALGQTFFVNI